MRFELTRPFERYHLKVVRLPISPPTHKQRAKIFEVGAKIGFLGNFSVGWRGDFFEKRARGGVSDKGAGVAGRWWWFADQGDDVRTVAIIFGGRCGRWCLCRDRNGGRIAGLCGIVR